MSDLLQLDGTEVEAPKPEVAAVAKTVLAAYFEELAKTDGFSEIEPKLRVLVLNDGVLSESAIRAAMFSDMP